MVMTAREIEIKLFGLITSTITFSLGKPDIPRTKTVIKENHMNAKTVLKYASDQGAKFVSVRFTDFPGAWQHFTFPIGELLL